MSNTITNTNTHLLLTLIDLLASVVTLTVEMQAKFDAQKALIIKIIDEKREPTSAEWNELNQSIAKQRQALHTTKTTPKE